MLNIDNSILVIIDIQDRLVGMSKYGLEVAQNATKLTNAASILNIPTIITEQYPQGLGQTVFELRSNLTSETCTIEKTAFSAMLEPEFVNKLKTTERKQVILCGIETHICVLQTAFDLIKEGYEVYIVKDACASRNKKEYKTGLNLLQQYGAKISCVEIALFELLKTSKHPNFKEIQALIK
ncbi:hydrolase [bacterium]|nr:hydrolase [bacterium]